MRDLLIITAMWFTSVSCARSPAVQPDPAEPIELDVPAVAAAGEMSEPAAVKVAEPIEQAQPESPRSGFDHSAFDQLLKNFVKGDALDYKGLKGQRARLDTYIARLAGTSDKMLETYSKHERMAFFINAYNAITLQQIVRSYPIDSIQQIDQVWDNKHVVAGKKVSLNEIEHEILRKKYRDARIHFAVNCASVGCPPLRAEAFTGEQLEQQLDEQARRFVTDAQRNKIAAGKVQVSEIFDWFGEDFGGPKAFEGFGANPAAVLAYLKKYATREQKAVLDSAQASDVSYLSYDWALNDSTR